MAIPDCATKDCFGALVATNSHGLFKSKNIIVYDDSTPKWEHVGQVLPISRIDFDYRNPKETQVCLSGGSVWLRRASVNDNWVQILTTANIATLLYEMGHTGDLAELYISDVKYIANGRCFVTFGARGATDFDPVGGGWFMRSLDYGNIWTITKQLNQSIWSSSGGIGIQYSRNAKYASDQIIYVGAYYRTVSGFTPGSIVYSKDQGLTWGPTDDDGNIKLLGQTGGRGGWQAPVASRRYIDACYTYIKDVGLNRLDGWCEGGSAEKDGDLVLNATQSKQSMYHPTANRAYVCGGNPIYYTWTLESALPTPLWYSFEQPFSARHRVNFAACTDYAQNMLYGLNGTLGNWYFGRHFVWGTNNDFANVFWKSGANTNVEVTNGVFDTESIPYNCGGVSRAGIAMYLDSDTGDDEPKVPTASGWPIWLTAGATEMRRDPTGDRLYVVAETDWPTGDGLWQQPLLFQFILSGSLAGKYYENVGHLAFLPTLTVGGSDIYSGSMNYDGLLEMHTEAPLSHGVVVAGKFADGKQVYYNDNIHASLYTYTSGWPVSGWDLVGTFGSDRVTSVAQNFTLVDDMTISHTNMATVSGIATTPWLWANKLAVPFLVNTQLREGNNAFVGVEGAGESEPIQLATVISGLVSEYPTWVNRGAGLPEVQINRIKRSDA